MKSNQQHRSAMPASGVTLALIAFSGFPLGDALVKSMASDWPASAVGALRFSISAFALAIILWCIEGRSGFRIDRPWLHAARGLALAVATLAFFSAIYVMPLAEAAAIAFVNPIITALLSGWILKEKMRPATWLATVVGFAGVLVMLRPNIAEFGWVAALPLVSAFAIAMMLILNRMVSTQRSIFAAQFYISFWTALFLVVASLAGHFIFPALRVSELPDWDVILRCAVVAVTATGCHFLLFMATMRTTAAAIAPIVYIQLIISSLISVYIFDDPLDSMALAGGGLILIGGLLLWRSERRATTVLEA